jgi:hypothetical protein
MPVIAAYASPSLSVRCPTWTSSTVRRVRGHPDPRGPRPLLDALCQLIDEADTDPDADFSVGHMICFTGHRPTKALGVSIMPCLVLGLDQT